MTSLIINLPHLQSRRQRRGALLLSLVCWAWFVMPLVIVGGWLLGFQLAQGVVWLGGWQSLVRLAGIAAAIIVALTALWTVWTLAEIRRERRRPAVAPTAPAGVATGFAVDARTLMLARRALVTTVYFAADGGIAAVVPKGAAPADQRRAA
jgi:poly-beta-1,6-N-acetyl-D-glucosamine biosynthesis protein PgaD